MLFDQALNSYDRGAVLENDHRYIKESGAFNAVHWKLIFLKVYVQLEWW